MKPRLESAPLTDEDKRIWRRVCVYGFHVPASLRCYRHDVCAEKFARFCDRRDADLMYWAQTIRRPRAGGYRMLGVLDDRVSGADPNPIDYGGDITRLVR